jgi:hypothetical protein
MCSDSHGMDSKEIGVEREEWNHMHQNKNKLRDYEHVHTTWRKGVTLFC